MVGRNKEHLAGDHQTIRRSGHPTSSVSVPRRGFVVFLLVAVVVLVVAALIAFQSPEESVAEFHVIETN
jgi:hypothetical protein